MKITIYELKRLIRESNEWKVEPFDAYFIENIVPLIEESETLPGKLGRKLGHGHEAVVYEFTGDTVVRLEPTYEDWPDQIQEKLQRQKNAPSGGLYVDVIDVGLAKGYDSERDEDTTWAVYTVMEKVDQLSQDEAEEIDAVVLKRKTVDDVTELTLQSFLKRYMTLSVDHDSRNVMKRGDDYVIIDPE